MLFPSGREICRTQPEKCPQHQGMKNAAQQTKCSVLPSCQGAAEHPRPARKAGRLLEFSWMRGITANPLWMWIFGKHLLLAGCAHGRTSHGHLLVSSHGELFSLAVPQLMKLKWDFGEEKTSCSFPGWVLLLQAPKSMCAFCLTKTMCPVLWAPLTAADCS